MTCQLLAKTFGSCWPLLYGAGHLQVSNTVEVPWVKNEASGERDSLHVANHVWLPLQYRCDSWIELARKGTTRGRQWRGRLASAYLYYMRQVPLQVSDVASIPWLKVTVRVVAACLAAAVGYPMK
jgi:hypothetical protein